MSDMLAAWLALFRLIPDGVWIGVACAVAYWIVLLPLEGAWSRYLDAAIDRRLEHHGLARRPRDRT